MRYKNVEKTITEIYNAVFKKVYNANNVARLSKGKKNSIALTVKHLENSRQFNQFSEKFAKKLAEKAIGHQRGIWRKYFKAAKAKGHIAISVTYKMFEYSIFKTAVQHNFEMIKTIPEEMLKLAEREYTNTLIEQVANGTIGRKSFFKQLKQHGVKNAGVIARTETAKLQTTITEQRATDLGSVAYIWRSSKDRRTRPSHRKMNNVVVFWRQDTEKPLLDKMYGNAGEFPNCRCNPLPIFDEDDLSQSMYNVYDYRSHRIISMRKVDLLTAMQNGGLN